MRILGPRTLIRYVILVSLPSVVMFIYVLTQTIPMVINSNNQATVQVVDVPIVVTLPQVDTGLQEGDDGGERVRYVDGVGQQHGAEPIQKGEEITTPKQVRPSQKLFPSGIWEQVDVNLEDSVNLQSIGSENPTLLNPIYEDISWDEVIESKFLLVRSNYSDIDDIEEVYNLATPDSHQVTLKDIQSLNVPPNDPNMPSQQELEQYFLTNYKANMDKGFSRFSLGVREEMLEQGPLRLPQLLPNLRVPCWVEDVPTDFTYAHNIYHCHINNRRIKAGFEAMGDIFRQRQSYSGFKWRVRCLPSFYLIGVAKCGTTDLFEALTRHPQILRPDLKEPEFWPYLRFGLNDLILNMTCAQDKGHSTFSDYLDTFDLTSESVKGSLRKNDQDQLESNVLFGDYSTHTFIDLFDWNKTLDAPDKINADHIYNVWPQSKFIIILRDPIDRAYSRYKMRLVRQINVKGTPQDFHKRVMKQITTTNDCMKEHSRRYCVYKATFGKGDSGTNALLNSGLYVIYLQDWLRVFPLKQFLVIKFEDYIQDRTKTISDITDFLQMESLAEGYIDIIDQMAVMNVGKDIGGVLPDTRRVLQMFYKPYNTELAQILGDERFKFGY